MSTTLIDMIRHGEPVGGHRYRGQIDDPLSGEGWQQMRKSVGEHCPWDAVISSPLSRCAAFATELAEHHRLPLHLEPRLMEIGFGCWEGRTADDIRAENPQLIERFWRDPFNNRPAGAEALMVFRDRVIAAWDEICRTYSGCHVLLVGHAGQMRAVLCHVLGMPIERLFCIHIPNAAISRIRIDGEDDNALPRLLFHDGRLA